MDILRGIIGITVILFIAVVFSKNRKAINWKLVGSGLGIQFLLAGLIMKDRELSEIWAHL
ncbi:MAG: Na+ dependent nucleoside transporter N-terminal domain-containing protein [Balneolaceae bacterium]